MSVVAEPLQRVMFVCDCGEEWHLGRLREYGLDYPSFVKTIMAGRRPTGCWVDQTHTVCPMCQCEKNTCLACYDRFCAECPDSVFERCSGEGLDRHSSQPLSGCRIRLFYKRTGAGEAKLA
jgi:hypothetical protein